MKRKNKVNAANVFSGINTLKVFSSTTSKPTENSTPQFITSTIPKSAVSTTPQAFTFTPLPNTAINSSKLTSSKNKNQDEIDSDSEEDEEENSESELNILGTKGDQKHQQVINQFIKAHYDKEMSVINVQISCFAYWKVVEKRFVDYFHLTILSKLLIYFKDLPNIFDKKFAPNTNEQAKMWICEDPALSSKREKIEKSLEAFKEAAEQMNKIC